MLRDVTGPVNGHFVGVVKPGFATSRAQFVTEVKIIGTYNTSLFLRLVVAGLSGGGEHFRDLGPVGRLGHRLGGHVEAVDGGRVRSLLQEELDRLGLPCLDGCEQRRRSSQVSRVHVRPGQPTCT